ncbi:hypothetical protein EST38_g9520 [Candolleomyces aberdarensis]|uniref:Uncharacterized protein n=1 Tax=Candolleomyces aberdarensis TaxID=2316362 RepID=A0A4Q2D9Q1_9AGAR|nr:hypothetical protein EST38_g9520 [Candolleomyces aberdarensis]
MALHHMLTFVGPLFEYTLSIGRPSVRYLRYPLTTILLLFLVIYVVVILFIILVASLLNAVSSAFLLVFSPIWYGPGFSLTAMCKWVTHMASLPPESGLRKVMWADYPGLVEVQSRRFEQIIDNTLTSGTSGSSLSLHIKKAEMATADLIALVRLSNLPSKNSLVKTLSDFVRDAKITEESLHKLDSEVNGAIDSIMAMNNFAMQAIDSARATELGAFGALMIWKPSEKATDEVVKETFSDAIRYISKHLERLVEHGANCANLDRLEQGLSTLRDIVSEEKKTVGEAKEKLLANLWTMLGGNRSDLRNINRNLELLHELTVYREHALAHVVAALHTVRTVDQELQEMRERVAKFAGDKVAPDVHMNSIKNGLKRLKELHGSGSRATSPPSSNLAPVDHYDDVDDDGYVSLNRNGAEYRQDGDEDQLDQWVDEEADTVPRLTASSNSRAAQPGGHLRKRRRGSRAPSAGSRIPRATSYRPSHVARAPLPSLSITKATPAGASRQSRHATPAPAPAPVPAPTPPLPPPLPLELPTTRTALHHTLTLIGWLFEYAMSIVRPALSYFRYPLIIILLLFLVAALLNKVTFALSSAFSPICYAPGFSLTPMCKWVTQMASQPSGGAHDPHKVQWADYSGLVDVQSRTFEQLAEDSLTSGVSGSSLSLHIKKAEMATADLIALIRLSDLHSRDSLVDTLSEFVQDARITEMSLHRLDSKVNGAIDSIMAMNDFAMRSIDSARANEPGPFEALMIWRPSKKPTDEVVRETFSDAMHLMSGQLERLIVEHEANHANLDRLEEKLSTLRDIVARENKTVGEAKEELLGNLWTMLGGNKKDLRNFETNLKLLHDLTLYRKHASAHVVAALHTLKSVSQDMEDMRERVAAPNLAGSRIAPEVHMNSIKHGLERLKEGRTRARQIGEAAFRQALGLDEDGFELGS